MRDVNQMLEQYIEVPRAQSLPKMKYIPTPGDLSPENEEEFELMMQEFYRNSRFTYDTTEYEKFKAHLEEFQHYRKKFEQSQRVLFSKANETTAKQATSNGVPILNLQALDPKQM